MYLRGIQFPELESIIEFIYLGEATFYEERMDEFLTVAKLLGIKELCNAKTETEDDLENTSYPSNLLPPSYENFQEETVIHGNINKQVDQGRRDLAVMTNNKYECETCHKTYYDRSTLNKHKKAVHEGIKYACDQCNYNATQKNDLNRHISSLHVSKHEDVKYACDQCEFQTTRKDSLGRHIKNKHYA